MAASIVRAPVKGTWARQVPAGGDALATRPRRTPGRLHRPGEIALYLADTPQTAWAEWYRALAARAQNPADDVPRELYEVTVDLDDVIDLSSPRLRQEAALPARMLPSESQWPRFQRFATAMRAEGARGVLYSSAARTRSLCLCVFEAGRGGLRVDHEPVSVISPPPPPRGTRT